MQIKESDTSLQVFGREDAERFDPRFVTTQFEIIQRKEILYPVIENLQLERKWQVNSREVAYAMLRKRLNMRELRNTDLIQISVLDQERNQAAEIANAIAEEYQRRRIAEQQEWLNRSLIQLQDEVAKQRRKVEELREAAARIRVQYAINDLNPESAEDPMQAREKVLLSEEEQVNNERLKVTALRAKQDQVSQMTDDQIMRSIRALDIEDPTILQVLPAYQEAVSEEARLLNSGLGANHPTVKSQRARKDVMERQLGEQIQVLRKTLADNLRIAEDQLAKLEAGLENSRELQQESKTRASAYFVAKNDYIQAKKLLEAAEMRLSTETMQRTMPQSPVTIWERAEPSQFSARPRVMLNLALSVVVGLAFGFGLAFFVEHLDTSVKSIEDVESSPLRAGSGSHPEEYQPPYGCGSGSWRCGGLPDHANQHRVQPEISHGEHYSHYQRRTRRGKVHHRRKSRLYLRARRISDAPGGGRSASTDPEQNFRRVERARTDGLLIIAKAA